MDKDSIWNSISKNDVEYLSMQFSDLHGTVKEIIIPSSKYDDAITYGVWFDGSSIEGFTRIQESDLFIKPDLKTAILIPRHLKEDEIPTMRFICDTFNPDGSPFEGDPRFILKRALKKIEEENLIFNVGPEVEFYFFSNDQIIDKKSYFDIFPSNGHQVMKELGLMLQRFGIEVEAMHHEVGNGQYELDFRYQDALTIADQVITLKYIIRKISSLYGLTATFMPKPISGSPGSGMHTHMSLINSKNGENLFFDENDSLHLSSTAYNFIAGLIDHSKAICAVTNPTINSYKRLVEGYEAPVYITWGRMNRSALVRVPRWFKGKKSSARIELRSPDPSCNPYLAFATMLMTGYDGIKRKLPIQEPVEENVYKMDKERINGDVLPTSLYEAMQYMKKDSIIKETFGKHLYERYYSAKMSEWNDYRMQVTNWERKMYFETA
ncbi:MAG: glutamine synthetase family protein [Candidatus Hodarchaeales archaeon]|jgi:glutamine synthetase